jgi:hypothetical protein
MYTPHHVWNLGKSINKIWGNDMTETLLEISTTSLKLNNNDRRQIYDIFKDALERIESGNYNLSEKQVILTICYNEYSVIVDKIIK